jgi:hypothetical protein
LLADLAERTISAAGEQAREVASHGADGRRNRHVVVVEDDNQARIHRPGIVHGLVGHTRRQRAIADHGDHIIFLARQIACDGHAERRRNRRGRVRGAERVVFAFGAFGKAGQAVAHAQGPDAIAAAGENLVGIGLVADIPDQSVFRGVEDVVQSDRQFDDAEARAQVPARDRHGIDCLGAQLVGDLPKLALVEPPQIVRGVDLV